MQGGDDLIDDFVPDELVALSEEENDLEEEDAGGSISGEEGDVAGTSTATQAAVEKKRKRRAKEKERKAKKRKFAETQSLEAISVAAQPPIQLSEYISSMQAKTFSKLSGIELGDLQIPENCIADTVAWSGSRSLDQLPDFIVQMCPDLRTQLSQRPKHNGAPFMILVCGAALRVADATRVLKTKALRGEKGGDVAKLFAKHIKLEEHVKYLKRTKFGAAAGTPGRLGKLLEADALSVVSLTHIILDVSYLDSKKRSLLDIPETRDEVFRLFLGSPKVLQAMRAGQVKLVLF
ncbi:hypothetical protein OE88DRAFT_1674959 [Heliocybe sulcata]|uniref:Protein CMS1 n=1 Tax=Heliocybe sulcata TaxID=5364 RepID=A0A5C3NFK4_9AGAM|nr:hypothetical protein OE88DRAFT_1674959 [Heliocybe sulcata]